MLSRNSLLQLIGPILTKSIPSTKVNPLYYAKNIPNSIVITDVTDDKGYNVIKSMTNSSAGCNGFPTSIAKQCDSKVFGLSLT